MFGLRLLSFPTLVCALTLSPPPSPPNHHDRCARTPTSHSSNLLCEPDCGLWTVSLCTSFVFSALSPVPRSSILPLPSAQVCTCDLAISARHLQPALPLVGACLDPPLLFFTSILGNNSPWLACYLLTGQCSTCYVPSLVHSV
ncbi:hypothetical protein FA13DRAFT_655943 [Coprinellus micaceus]|uniref:Hydrophobin n=1 Tax=Coprinellus micaceus TaxID=71717 RepID=A0A4Y7SAK1_COPMI|nr:hypothetical protein FA13DRAFT_655943 [Coprinellus micaceus]